MSNPLAGLSASLIWNNGEEQAESLDPSADQTSENNSTRRTSMYVRLFETMIKEVLSLEYHLFSYEEIGIFKAYNKLSPGARFLLVRLSLRTAGKWIRFDEKSMDYVSELGPNIPKVMDELCTNAKVKFGQERQIAIQKEQHLNPPACIIDLTSDGEEPIQDIKSESQDFKVKLEDLSSSIPNIKAQSEEVNLEDQSGRPPDTLDNSFDYTILAEHEDYASLEELIDCLNNDELRTLAKSMRVDSTGKRNKLIQSLLSFASTQTTLSFTSSKARTKNSKSHKHNQPIFSSQRQNQRSRLRQMVMEKLQKCIRINAEVINIFRRLHLVYYRCTQYSPDLLLPSILVGSKKRHYFDYSPKRTPDIWPSREALLEYEDALITEFRIDEVLAGASSLSPAVRTRSMTSQTPVPVDSRPSDVPSTPGSVCSHLPCRQGTEKPSSRLQGRSAVEEPRQQVKDAMLVEKIFQPAYQKLVMLITKPDPDYVRRKGLERFDCGHVLTRIVCKGANALGVLKEYSHELAVLETLLSQTLWRTGKRGSWHDRRALILMTHMSKNMETLQAAKAAVEAGLDDPYTNSIWQQKLQRRLATLEKRLKIPLEDRRASSGELKKADEITIVGRRIQSPADVSVLNKKRKPVSKMSPPLPAPQTLTQYFSVPSHAQFESDKKLEAKREKVTGKTVWRGRNDEQLSVEMFALQHYESLGYKGFHSEGRIVYTIFGLLFWDIIFAPIPGSFETSCQTAPLDITEDTFYTSRKDLIVDRLSEIEDGKASAILKANDQKHRKQGTLCIGVRWDLCERQDLLEIIDCISDIPLSKICRIICEDYSSRAGGLPDLIVWDTSKTEKRCMFIEVKGPGDSLQENQKAWIDLLIRANVSVEVCRVADEGEASVLASPSKKRKRASKRGAKKDFVIGSDTEDEPAYDSAGDDEDSVPHKRIKSSSATPVVRKLHWPPTPTLKKRKRAS